MITDNINEFTKTYCTDNLHKKVILELSTRKNAEKTGRKIGLTTKMLRDFLYYVSMGCSLKEAAEITYIGENNRKDYAQRSETFSYVSSLAKNYVSIRSRMTVAQAIMGRKPSYYKIIHPVTKQPTYFELKEIQPNVNAAMWWLERVDKVGAPNDSEEIPRLGAPRNEEEAYILESSS